MVKKVYLIGIGPGDPKYLTILAKEVIQRLKVFLVPEKEGKKSDLTKKRLKIIEFIKAKEPFEVVYLPFPERERGVNYKEKVQEWRLRKGEILKKTLLLLKEEEVGFLIWGDPVIYDGHIEIFKEIEKELPIEWEVIPGISAFQVLGAKFKISLTDLATSLTFHTPRTLRKLKEISHPTVVFLDNYATFSLFKEKLLRIYWGAYVGQEEEVYLEGDLKETLETLKELRETLREKKGYLMEIYLLKPKEEKNG